VKGQDYTATITVDKSPEAALKAIQNLRGWWSKDIKGDTANVGDECTHQFKDVHRCTLKCSQKESCLASLGQLLQFHER
jgi:hypothetical protein